MSENERSEETQPCTECAVEQLPEDEEKPQPVEDYESKWKRALADLDNMRKRTEREMDSLRKYGGEPLVLDLLRFVEDLERALSASKGTKAKLIEGLNLILCDIKCTMARHGVSEIDSVGVAFDASLHEAVAQSETGCTEENDIIVEEIQKGYKLHDKVMRHAKVKVAKHKGE